MAGSCALRNKIKQLAGRLQNAEEVAEVLNANDVFPTVFEVDPSYEVSQFERTPFRSDLSKEANITGTILTNVNFQIEPKGQGTAGQRPNYADYLMASGLAEVKLVAITVSATSGGPLTMGDTLTDGDGATYRLFVQPRSVTELVAYRLTGSGTPTTLTLAGPASYAATFDSVDEEYGWGFEPHSIVTSTVALNASPNYTPGETVVGSISGGTARVIYMGSSQLWYKSINAIDFVNNDVITGQSSTLSATATADAGCGFPTPPMTLYVNQDGVRTTVPGARGRVNVSFGAVGEPGRFEFEMQGPSGANPIDSAPFAETADNLIPPKFQGATIQLDVGGTVYVPVLSQMNIQVDNTLSSRMDATSTSGIRSVIITDRDFNGAFDPEMVPVATFGFHAKWFSDTLERFYASVGSVAGNIVEFYVEKIQYTGISFGNREELLLAGTDFKCVRNISDDAMKIVVR
jgi:hypothetical protein